MSFNFKCRQVDKYDGQSIYANGKVVYDLGNYLGGGASGSVYQGFEPSWAGTEKAVAIKILNPLGYKNVVFGQINQCTILLKGRSLSSEQVHGKAQMISENVWWMMHPTSKLIFAAFEDPHRMQLRELPLTRCVEIWGMNPLNIEHINSEADMDKVNVSQQTVSVNNRSIRLPLVSPKYLKFLKSRQMVCREMSNMAQVGEHPNIVSLLEVLELVQDSKTTLFLVLELVNGGELFDRLKAGIHGNVEDFARRYFTQLISGLEYCHKKGVVHRDLKPENLLLSDPSDSAILKIGDFGLSAVVFAAEASSLASSVPMDVRELRVSSGRKEVLTTPPKASNVGAASVSPLASGDLAPGSVRRLRSVVGSPHYIAPEIGLDDPAGYDGRKVDMWSAGVILYSLFTGSLPFGSDLSCCPRFKRYKHWMCTEYVQSVRENREIVVPHWFWPVQASPSVGSLLVGLLQFDPTLRLTASEVMRHPWFLGHTSCGNSISLPMITRQSSPELPPPIIRLASVASNNSQSSQSSRNQNLPCPIPTPQGSASLSIQENYHMVGTTAVRNNGQEVSTITRLLQSVAFNEELPSANASQSGYMANREQLRQKEAAAMMGSGSSAVGQENHTVTLRRTGLERRFPCSGRSNSPFDANEREDKPHTEEQS